MAAVRVRAFAKVNLSLEVLNRGPDGFHNLRTVFQTISLSDILDIDAERSRSTRVSIESSVQIPGENLIVRAAHAVLEAARVRASIRFTLHKKIPMGAGLGGGSADAAAVLLALPGLLGKSLSHERRIEIGASLGSDVPVFLLGGTVLGLGRGSELYPLPDLPALRLLLVAPEIHVSTAEAYASLGRTADYAASASAAERVTHAMAFSGPWPEACVNDFEESVFSRHPELASVRRKLVRAGALLARMTGSGSSIFGLFRTREQREAAARLFPGVRVFRATVLSRSRYVKMRVVPQPSL